MYHSYSIILLFYLAVGAVRPARDQPPHLPRHDVAGPSLDMDLFKAEIGGEAGLGGADVSLAIVLYIDGSYCSVTVYNYCSRPGWLVAVELAQT